MTKKNIEKQSYTMSKITRLMSYSALGLCLSLTGPAFAGDQLNDETGKTHDNGQVFIKNAPVNTEADVFRNESRPAFSITGQDQKSDIYEWNQRAADMALARANIQIKNDGLDLNPRLNATIEGNRVAVDRSQATTFHTFWNYGNFIDRAEIRIFAADNSVRDEQVKILPVKNGIATLPAGSDLEDDLIYVLRVYDKNGRFDETEAKNLTLLDKAIDVVNENGINKTLEGYGLDRTAFRNIKVRGSAVTVHGFDVPQGGAIAVNGRSVPVDVDGRFVYQEILPFGDHEVDVSVIHAGQEARFQRDIHIAGTDLFYVALGDLTLGSSHSVRPADFLAESDEDFDDVTVAGRGAMYLKGRFKGDYRVTAAIDTGEDRLEDLFNNLDEKDPRQLLRRLDGDRFYPVYGDDSTTVEDAPTQGRFYVRVEKDDSHVMWGNFSTQITGTEFAHLDRGLYGGIADIKSRSVTETGDRKTHVTLFAADPGTLPAREEFRGTGGSLYFLERQDITIGSERIRIEYRDKVSGLVSETRDLRPQEDYDIDYIQGRVVLSQPLSSFTRDNQIVRSSALSGDEVYLTVRYEYTPSLSDVGGYTIGGRATQWLGDNLRIGATAQEETTGLADQNLMGVDLLLRKSTGTYLKAEFAQTKGPGFGQSGSVDGGFNFNSTATTGISNVKADAYRLEVAADLSDITDGVGRVSAYYDHQDAGFSGAGRLLPGEVDRYGAALGTQLGKSTALNLKYDEVDANLQGNTRAIYGDLSQTIGEDLTIAIGLRHDDRQIAAIGSLNAVDGSRTDGTLQVNYDLSQQSNLYGFAQATLDSDASRPQNDRYGLGADIRLNDRLSLAGELSDGDMGFGAQVKATMQRVDGSEFYLGYALSTDRRDTGFNTQYSNHDGTLTLGGRKRFNDSLSVYGEERYGYGGTQTSLTHAYGLNFNPSEKWSFGLSAENGRVEQDQTGEVFDRTAVAFSAGHAGETTRIATSLEARFEDSQGAAVNRERTTWFMRNSIAYDANKDWELLGRFNFAISESDQSSFLDADFVEGVLGAAYRPVKNDRINMLFKYTYFEDLAPAGQITSGGTNESARQKSQVLGVDVIYDLTEKLSVGGKYGYRSGEVAFDRESDVFIKSDAHLGVIRLDYHIVKEWDILAEGRLLSSNLAEDERLGALVGLYRHVGENAKIGVGYNFAKYSDDLTDFDNNSDGFFVNLVGKF